MRTRDVVVGLGSLSLLTAGGLAVLPSSAGAATEPVVVQFAYSGAAASFDVPSGICSVVVDLYGAQGGDFGGPILGGAGGRATATITVTPGETLQVNVGGKPAGTSGGSGGFNGGGAGAVSTGNQSGSVGGGGATDVRRGGSGLADRVVVAGGGGGRSNGGGNGGLGGGLTGGAGEGAGAGGGATQSAGGTPVGNGGTGQFGLGGAGGEGLYLAGGGGGGGWYGGAGGAGDPNAGNAAAGTGGGGSGYGPAGVVFESGVRTGNGQATISYDPAAQPAGCGVTPTTAIPSTTSTAAAQPLALAPRFTG